MNKAKTKISAAVSSIVTRWAYKVTADDLKLAKPFYDKAIEINQSKENA